MLNLCVGRRTSAVAKAEHGLTGGPGFTTTVRAEDEFIEIDLELAVAHTVSQNAEDFLGFPSKLQISQSFLQRMLFDHLEYAGGS